METYNEINVVFMSATTTSILQKCIFFKGFLGFSLFISRERGRRENERERNINVWLPLAHLQLGPGSQPRHVP